MSNGNAKRGPDWAWVHANCADEAQGIPPAHGHRCLDPTGCSARAECERRG